MWQVVPVPLHHCLTFHSLAASLVAGWNGAIHELNTTLHHPEYIASVLSMGMTSVPMVSMMSRQVGMPLAGNGGMGPLLVAPCGEGDQWFMGLTQSIWRTRSISESHYWSSICGTSGAISMWSSECSMAVLPTLVCCSIASLGLASTSFWQIISKVCSITLPVHFLVGVPVNLSHYHWGQTTLLVELPATVNYHRHSTLVRIQRQCPHSPDVTTNAWNMPQSHSYASLRGHEAR